MSSVAIRLEQARERLQLLREQGRSTELDFAIRRVRRLEALVDLDVDRADEPEPGEAA